MCLRPPAAGGPAFLAGYKKSVEPMLHSLEALGSLDGNGRRPHTNYAEPTGLTIRAVGSVIRHKNFLGSQRKRLPLFHRKYSFFRGIHNLSPLSMLLHDSIRRFLAPFLCSGWMTSVHCWTGPAVLTARPMLLRPAAKGPSRAPSCPSAGRATERRPPLRLPSDRFPGSASCRNIRPSGGRYPHWSAHWRRRGRVRPPRPRAHAGMRTAVLQEEDDAASPCPPA